VDILHKALEDPTKQIIYNAGKEGSVIVEKVKAEKGNIGYNALTDKLVDMLEEGIIDPTKVTRSALQNAVSVAGLMITTEATITELPEDKDEGGGGPQMPPGGAPGMM